ncbi:hypothetical protein PilKf_02030 [Pillotina sp. SPG140]|jgi:uncharacterized membrane protein
MNMAVAPLCWLFLSTGHRFFLRFKWYQKISQYGIERARAKIHKGIERWGWFGIALFVAIPLPMTGAWTATVGAWILGVEKRRTFIAVSAGVLVSGIIVTLATVCGATIIKTL